MKKIVVLLFAIILTISCDLGGSIEVTSDSRFRDFVPISIPATSGTPSVYSETKGQDLSELIQDYDKITAIDITGLSYKFRNAEGNSNAVIQNATISINGDIVATISNVNITELSGNGTSFPITDTAILNQIEENLLSGPTITIQFSGSALSDGSAIDFEVEVTINLSVTKEA